MFSNWMSSLIVQNHMRVFGTVILTIRGATKATITTVHSSVLIILDFWCVLSSSDAKILVFKRIPLEIGQISLSKHATVHHFYYIHTATLTLCPNLIGKKISYDDVIHTEYYHFVATFLSLFIYMLSLSKISINLLFDHLILHLFLPIFRFDLVFYTNFASRKLDDRTHLDLVSFKRHTLTHSLNQIWGNWFSGLGLHRDIIVKSMNLSQSLWCLWHANFIGLAFNTKKNTYSAKMNAETESLVLWQFENKFQICQWIW